MLQPPAHVLIRAKESDGRAARGRRAALVCVIVPNDRAVRHNALQRFPLRCCLDANGRATMMAERRDCDVRPVHVRNPERVDGAKGLQDLPTKFDPMSGVCQSERIGYLDGAEMIDSD